MAFTFRNNPLKYFYLVFLVISIIFIRLPFWVLSSILPSSRPRASWSLRKCVTVRFLQAYVSAMYDVGFPAAQAPNPSKIAAAQNSHVVAVPGLSTDLIVGQVANIAKMNGVDPTTICAYWCNKGGLVKEPSKLASPQQKYLLYLHGGGHVFGNGNPVDDSAGSSSAPPILSKTAGILDYAFSPEFRLCASEPFPRANPFPANLLDALAAYKYLLNDVGVSPSNIIVSGASSGGHLAFDLVLYLVQNKLDSLPFPAGLLLLSPTVDWAETHDNGVTCSMNHNSSADIVGPILKSGYSARALRGALPENEVATNPYLSPASLLIQKPEGLYSGFPRTCIVAGEAEQTLDPMRTLSDRLVADNPDNTVRYLEYPDSNHTFLTMSIFEPQRTQALTDICKWIKEVFD